MNDNKLYFCQEALDYANPFDCCNECHCENKKEQILCRKRMFLQSRRTIIGMDDGWIEFDWDKYQNAVDFIINHINKLEWKDGKWNKLEKNTIMINECIKNKKEQASCLKDIFLKSKLIITGMHDYWLEFDGENFQNAVDFVINHIDRLEWTND